MTIPKINLIIAKREKLLMVAIYRQGFCTLLVHIFLSFFLEESVKGSTHSHTKLDTTRWETILNVTEQSEAIRSVLRNVKTSDEINCFFSGEFSSFGEIFFKKIIFYIIFRFKKKIAKYLLLYLKKCRGIVKYWFYFFLQILRWVHAGKHWFLISRKKIQNKGIVHHKIPYFLKRHFLNFQWKWKKLYMRQFATIEHNF